VTYNFYYGNQKSAPVYKHFVPKGIFSERLLKPGVNEKYALVSL